MHFNNTVLTYIEITYFTVISIEKILLLDSIAIIAKMVGILLIEFDEV